MSDPLHSAAGSAFLMEDNRTLGHHDQGGMAGNSFLPNGSVNGSWFGADVDVGAPFDMDLTNVSYPGSFNSPLLQEMVVKIVFYSIVILCALLGNILVIFVVWKNKRMRTTTNYYIVNLAVSDLMVTSSCTWVHLVDNLTEGWILGAFFCKFNSFAQVLSLVSSIMTLTLISCDRFFGIVFAMKAHMTERRSAAFIIVIWVMAIGISSPLLAYRQQSTRQWLDHTEIWCDDTWPVLETSDHVTGALLDVSTPSRTVYYTFISVVLYFLPILVMSIAYTLIIWRLWSSHMPGERLESEIKAQDRVKKKVVIMLIIIMCVFAICWLPFQIAILYAEHRSDKKTPLPDWYPKFTFFANYIAYANSAFNPVIYTGFNENFRRGFKAVFRCRTRRKKRGDYYSAVTGQATMARDSESLRSLTMVTNLGGPSRHHPGGMNTVSDHSLKGY